MKINKHKILLLAALMIIIRAFAQTSPATFFYDDFNDGNFTDNPAWNLTAGGTGCWAPGTREVVNGTFHIIDMDSPGCGHSTTIDYLLNVPVDDSTRVMFDVNPVFSDVRNGAGDGNDEYPANVDLFLIDNLGTSLMLRFSYNYRGGASTTTSTYIRVAFPFVPQNVWQLDQNFRIRDYFPNAVTLSGIYIGGNGWDYESYFDNIQIYSTDSLSIFTSCQTVPGCPGEFLVPIIVTNCNNVGAISMKLNYNNAVLTYLGYQNVHSALSTGFLFVNSNGSRVMISWASTTAANVGDDTLMELRFTAIPGSSTLIWNTQTQGNCEYSDTNGQVIPSYWLNGAAIIYQPPLIAAHPASQAIAAGNSAAFTVTATGGGLGYQWQLSTNGGGSWEDITNGGLYSNVTTSTMGISDVELPMNGYRYRCKVTGTCTPVAYSNAALLTVTPTVITTCQTVTDCPGDLVIPVNVTNFLEVGAFSLKLNFNSSILSYTGYQNLNPILNDGTFSDNATGGSVFLTWYSTTAATLDSSAVLLELLFGGLTGTSTLVWDTITPGSCEYSDINGQVIFSDWVNGNVTVLQPPLVTVNPSNNTIPAGSSTTFSVGATGAGLGYQWQLSTNGGSSWEDLSNGGVYSNVTTSTVNLSNVLLEMNGNLYRCEVTGTCPPDTFSLQALLVVTPTIITTCQTVTDCPGDIVIPVNVANFLEVGAFSLKLNFNSSILTYAGYQNLNPTLNEGTFSNNSSGGSVYLTWYSTSAATIGNGDTLVELVFTGVTGNSLLVWDTITPGSCEYSNITGQVIFSDWINGNATVLQPPLVTIQPPNRAIPAGSSTTFSVSATGASLIYLWQLSTNGGGTWADLSNGGIYSNVTTAMMGIANAQLTMNNYRYRCKVSGNCTPEVYSNSALLTVTPLISTTCQTVTDCPGEIIIPVNVTNFIGVGAFSLKLDFNISILTYSGYQNLNPLLNNGTFTSNSNSGSVFLTWYSITPATLSNGAVLLELLFNGVPGTSMLVWDTITPGSCEYSDITGQVIFSDWVNGNVTVLQPPLVTVHPSNSTIPAGSSATFTISATGSSLSYLWQLSNNGGGTWADLSNIGVYSNVTTPTMGISNAPYSMNGDLYRCMVSGTCPPVAYSNSALLTVTPTPITTTATSVSNSCTRNLIIPVTVTNCNNVGSISLALQYDTTMMSFEGYQSVHPELGTSFFLVFRNGNKIGLSWASTDPANIGEDTIVEYRFKTNENISSTLTWDTQTPGSCEYSDINGVVITSFYNNANISVVSNAMLADAGDDIEMTPGDTVELNGTATGGTAPYTYLWTPSDWLSNPAIPNPLASPPEQTTYTLTITDNNNCTGSDKMQVIPVYNLPQVTTAAVTNITYQTASCGGNVTDDGGNTVTARGICWDTGNFPSITDSHSSDGTGEGPFTSQMTDLTPSTTYHVRAYAINAMGTAYGEQETFTTLNPPINQPPTIDSIPDPAPVAEDSGQQTINLTGIDDGNPEYVQNISITASSSNVNIIPHPTVNYTPNNSTGSISYTSLPNTNGSVTISVTVTDNGGTANGGMNTTVTTFFVVVLPVNDPPTANAGPNQTVIAGQVVTLNGSGSSDIDSDSLSFSWSAPAGIDLPDSTAIRPIFTSPVSCTNNNYTFSLVVNDGEVNSNPDQVLISTTPSLPDIVIAPSSLADTIASGTTSVKTLTIKNEGYCSLSLSLSSAASWLSLVPNSTALTTEGDSILIDVHFSATSLFAGIYTSEINISSDDPDEPAIHIPVNLTVTGDPFMVLSDTIMNYGTVFTGQTDGKIFVISNTGTDSLHIFNLSTTRPEYYTSVSNCVISPQGSKNVTITFAPATSGQINGILTIFSDNPGQSMDTVELTGQGLAPPAISVLPASLQETMHQNHSTTQQLMIINNGGSNLVFTTVVENATWLSVLPVSGSITPGNSATLNVAFCSGSLNPGNYSTTIYINSNDPVTPSISIPASMTVLQPMNVQASATPQLICLGSSTQLNALPGGGTGNYLYSWTSVPAGYTSTSQNPVVSPAVTTTYSVNVTDGLGNASSSVIVNVYLDEIPDAVSNMLPVDNSFDLQFPVTFSWAPATNASSYDLYIWLYNEPLPSVPVASNITQINYTFSGGSFTYGDTCKWEIVAKNPCFSTPGPIQIFSIHGLPELHVTDVTNSQPLAGQSMTVSWTVKNDGDYQTPGGLIWADRVWISPDLDVRIGEPEDILLGQFPNVSSLQPGESYIQTQQIVMPDNLIGAYFIFVITDAVDAIPVDLPPGGLPLPYNPPPYYAAASHGGSVVQEYADNYPSTNCHDNYFYKEINFVVPPLPDLIVTSFIAPGGSFSGQPVNITWTVKNDGDGITNTGTWSDRIYFSADTVLNPSTAYNLGTFDHTGILDPDSLYTETKSVNIPSNIFGRYYFFVKTDVNNTVFEHVYENNNILRSDSIHIVLTPPPDLVVTAVDIPDTVSTADTLRIEWTVTNQGASAPTVNTWQDGVYLTSLPNYDLTGSYYLGSNTQNQILAPGSSYYSSKVVNFTQNLTGPYYIYISTDLNNNVYEYLNENNNVLRSDTTIAIINPDLVVTSITIPSINSDGQPFLVLWTVKNNGPGKIYNRNWTDKILISHYSVYHPDSAIAIGDVNYIASLLPGESINKQKIISLPDNIAGDWYIFVYTDRNDNIFENINENNNILRCDNPIEILKPDLIVQNVIIPAVDSTGQPVDISWTVNNLGPGSILNRNWTDRIMLSYNPVYNSNTVTEIGTLNYTGSLVPGASYTKQKSVQLPESVPGPYFIYITTDYLNVICENGMEENNTGRSESTIQILRPDLIVTEIVIPDSGFSGESLNIEWITKNSGPVSIINTSWSERVMISASTFYNPELVMVLGTKELNGSLFSGDSLNNQLTATIPEGLQGLHYIYIYTDFSNTIPENIYENNNVTGVPIEVEIGTWADLEVTNIQVVDSSQAGSNIPLDFIVKNTGTKGIYQKSWSDRVFLSSSPTWNAGTATFLREFQQSVPLDSNENYTVNSSVNLPPGLTSGNFYIYVITDALNTIFEHTGESNNILCSDTLFITEIPPVDLAVMNVINPDSANSGQPVNIQWMVKNTGISTTGNSWYDAVYLSSDSTWNANADLFLGKRLHYGFLANGQSYSCSQAITLPNGISGDYYILVVADYEQVNNDDNLSNNWRSRTNTNNMMQTTHITLTPPPDLVVTSFTAPQQVTTGIPFTISWIVKNAGITATTNDFWTDKVYLSTDFNINAGDLLLVSKTRNGTLDVNEEYYESSLVTLPNNLSGNYILLAKTDFDNVVYEMDESNNLKYSFIVLSQPPPADLIVSAIDHPLEVIVGEPATIGWTLKNIWGNPANGNVKDMVYFSTDTTWDITDVLFGSYQSYISLGPGELATRNLNAKVNDLAMGQYYVIVKTDVMNAVYENNEDNNRSASGDNLFADVQVLPLSVLTPDTLNDFENHYFRIPIIDSLNNETMLTTFQADSIHGFNEMYQSHDEIPTRITYDYAGNIPYQGNQEIIVPSVIDGNYYMMLYGNTSTGNQQQINLKAEILQFGIRSVNPSSGGNIGLVTLKITGSKFDSLMGVRLKNDTIAVIANRIYYVDRSKVFATFDLAGLQPGMFDLVVERPDGDTTSLQNGFEVVAGIPYNLSVYIISPPSARPNRITSFVIEYANLGNTDIINPRTTITSQTIAPVALTEADLTNLYSELVVPLQEENGPPGILRPGAIGSVRIFTKTLAGLGFLINF